MHTTPIAKRSQKRNLWKERMRETEWCRASTRGQTKQPIRRVGGTRPPGDRDLVTYQPSGHWGQDIPYHTNHGFGCFPTSWLSLRARTSRSHRDWDNYPNSSTDLVRKKTGWAVKPRSKLLTISLSSYYQIWSVSWSLRSLPYPPLSGT